MKISKKILSLVLTVALVASINWTYVGELWSMISSAAMQMVSGHSVSTSALQHELETITLNKFLKIDIENLDDVVVDVLDDFLDEEIGSTEKDTTEDIAVEGGDTTSLNGHYHVLPAGTPMPDGLGIVADGIDVIPDSPHGVGHYTIFPTKEMTVREFNELYKSLPWQYGGKK